MSGYRGFTLLEILLVAALIGLAASVVMLSVGRSGPEQDVQTEAERFVALFQLVQEESEMSGDELGLRVEEDRYLWVMRDAEELWQPLDDDRFLLERQLDDGMRLALELEDLPFVDDDRLTQKGGLFEEQPLFEQQEEQQQFEPQLLVSPGGDTTPFSLTFSHVDVVGSWRVDVTELGDVVLLDPLAQQDAEAAR
ncbi:MAG: type II secretion system minor pseudopilin GspH [Gammaproteobacteria bacterium]|nr:type II secretion system minor pseudopilin GspH [Gammaproteobacteria bacterium]